MQLSQLLAGLEVIERLGDDVDITQVTADSRAVESGALFVAYAGLFLNGHNFIADAIIHGAAALCVEESRAMVQARLERQQALRPGSCLPALAAFPQVPTVQVSNGRVALAKLSAALNGCPSSRMTVIGVTGTDGKTTTVNLIYQMLRAAGRSTGMISTVNAVIGEQTYDTGLHTTTPDAPDIQHYLSRMLAAGSRYAILEATSEGLAQERLAAIDFDVAVVTNITHEHLYFHGNYENYFAAKRRLFEALAQSTHKPGVPKVAVLNAEDPYYERLRLVPAERQISYEVDNKADVQARNVRYGPAATSFTAVTPDRSIDIRTHLIGRYNVANCLAAISAGIGLGLPVEAIQAGIASLTGVSGRMERIPNNQGVLAIVDFAHTPNALAQALKTARTLTIGRVIVVFGSAGLRDIAKRTMMGEVAARLADLTVLTAEDPRTENLDNILATMAQACAAAGGREGETFWRVPDRSTAIAFAVSLARPGDVVMACGKGHEQSMCFGTTEYPWSDQEAMRAALAGQPGPVLPTAGRSEDRR